MKGLILLGLLLTGTLYSQQQDSVVVDRRLGWAVGLIRDSLVPLAGVRVPEVFVASAMSQRGQHRHGHDIRLQSTRDEWALLHEFGHHYAAARPAEYMEWAESLGLDPWTTATSEAFADAFASAFRVLSRNDGHWPSNPGGSRKPGDEFLGRHLQDRRPFMNAPVSALPPDLD